MYRTTGLYTAPTLTEVLAVGNETNGTDIAISTGDEVTSDADLDFYCDAGSNISIECPAVVNGNMTCTGNAYITGPLTSIGSATSFIYDNNLILNANHTTATPINGGVACIDSVSASTTSVSFTAGVEGVSDPYITVDSITGFSADCFVHVIGDGVNAGLYECVSASGSNITLKSTSFGLTSQDEDFTNNYITTEVSTDYTVQAVTLTLLKTDAGTWNYGSGSTQPVSLTALGASSPVKYIAYTWEDTAFDPITYTLVTSLYDLFTGEPYSGLTAVVDMIIYISWHVTGGTLTSSDSVQPAAKVGGSISAYQSLASAYHDYNADSFNYRESLTGVIKLAASDVLTFDYVPINPASGCLTILIMST